MIFIWNGITSFDPEARNRTLHHSIDSLERPIGKCITCDRDDGVGARATEEKECRRIEAHLLGRTARSRSKLFSFPPERYFKKVSLAALKYFVITSEKKWV